ncbi:MAG: hypothetical protein GF350_03250 [Chitinivibrionales bacterium]|nr:hypothetical protein [Chitinivibrionales bacterium]
MDRQYRGFGRTWSSVALAALFTVTAWSENASGGAFACRGIAEISFFGRSTLHGFEGQGVTEMFVLKGVVDTASGDTLVGTKIITRTEGLATKDEALNKNMYKTLGSGSYPVITAWIDKVPLEKLRPPAGTRGEFPFRLKVRDITQRLTATSSDWAMTSDSLVFTAQFDFSLSAFELQPPAPVFGLIKMEDIVKVTCRFRTEVTSEAAKTETGRQPARKQE